MEHKKKKMLTLTKLDCLAGDPVADLTMHRYHVSSTRAAYICPTASLEMSDTFTADYNSCVNTKNNYTRLVSKLSVTNAQMHYC